MMPILRNVMALALMVVTVRAEGGAVFNVTRADVTHTKVVYGVVDGVLLEIHLNPGAARRFSDFTRTNLMHVVEIRVEGEEVSSPTVREVITGPTLELKLDDPAKSEVLAKRLTGRS